MHSHRFTVGASGIELAPGYDMLCTAVYDTKLYADQNAIWPMTRLGTVLGSVDKFNAVTFQSLVDAGVALGLGAGTAQRLLGDMLRNIQDAAQDLMREVEGEYEALKSSADPHSAAPPPAVQAGELQLLRAIVHTVIADHGAPNSPEHTGRKRLTSNCLKPARSPAYRASPTTRAATRPARH